MLLYAPLLSVSSAVARVNNHDGVGVVTVVMARCQHGQCAPSVGLFIMRSARRMAKAVLAAAEMCTYTHFVGHITDCGMETQLQCLERDRKSTQRDVDVN